MIEIAGVSKIHPQGETQVAALRSVTCDFSDDSFTFIVGPSGSGKSTLLYLIGALDKPSGGEIHVDGKPLTQFSDRERNRYRRSDVGFIFQSFNLLGNLTAIENVLIPYLPKGVTAEQHRQARELLCQVGLEKRLHHRPNQLSGGEQQRVAIARALLKEPKIILADEPTGELDSQTGAEVFGYLRQLHKERQAIVIVVTHDERYFDESDRILRLRDGQVETPE